MIKSKLFIRLLLLAAALILLCQSGNILRVFFPVEYENVIKKYSQEYGVDPYMVMAVIKSESNFEQEAVSHKQARGLMQVTQSTAVWLAEKLGITDFSEDDIYKPDVNIRLGCYYLSYLSGLYGGNDKCALAAYNAGSGTVDQWLADGSYSKDGETLYKVPYRETEQYINKVLNYQKMYRILYRVRAGRQV